MQSTIKISLTRTPATWNAKVLGAAWARKADERRLPQSSAQVPGKAITIWVAEALLSSAGMTVLNRRILRSRRRYRTLSPRIIVLWLRNHHRLKSLSHLPSESLSTLRTNCQWACRVAAGPLHPLERLTDRTKTAFNWWTVSRIKKPRARISR